MEIKFTTTTTCLEARCLHHAYFTVSILQDAHAEYQLHTDHFPYVENETHEFGKDLIKSSIRLHVNISNDQSYKCEFHLIDGGVCSQKKTIVFAGIDLAPRI